MTTFEDLYAEHAAFVRMRLYILTQQRELAEDLCQETFLRAWCAWARLRNEDYLKAWLGKIAMNVVREYTRRRNSKLACTSYEGMLEGIDGAWDIEDMSQPDLAAHCAEADMRRAAFARLQPYQRRHLRRLAHDPDYTNKMEASRARVAYRKAYAAIEQEASA